MRRFISYVGAFVFLGLVAGALAACDLFGGDEDRGPRLEGIPGKIVFGAFRYENGERIDDGNIYVIDAGGTRQLTKRGSAGNPAWSPDGTQIVFSNAYKATTLGPYLYLMDADGSNMRFMKSYPHESIRAEIGWDPAWSPDGKHIAYSWCLNCERGGENYEIFVAKNLADRNFRRGDITQLTNNLASDRGPLWSPNGSKIAFLSGREYPHDYKFDLYLMNADGSNLRRLTENGEVGRYLWSPNRNKKRIAVSMDDELFLLDPENGNTKKLRVERPQGYDRAYPVDWPAPDMMLLSTDKESQSSFLVLNPKTGQTSVVATLDGYDVVGVDWFIPKQER